MKFLKNLKHIFAIWAGVMLLIFCMMNILGSSFIVPITQFFTYRDAPFQNFLYTHHWKPSTQDIAIIKIDETTINELQANSDRKMLTIPKSIYINLVKKLESIGVKGIAFDIVFQNKDPDEELFASLLKNNKNIVIGTTKRCIPHEAITLLEASGGAYISCEEPNKNAVDEVIQSIKNKKYNLLPYCFKDEDSSVYTCDGAPRSIYSGSQWGLLQINHDIYKRSTGIKLVGAPFFAPGESRYIPTLSQSLYEIIQSGSVNEPNASETLQPFFGGEGVYPYTSLSTVLSMEKRDLIVNFSDKYVFVGDTSITNHDMVTSPVTGNQMPGVETHAHMLDGILQNRIPATVNPEYFIAILLTMSLIMVTLYFLIPHVFSPFLAIIAFLFTIWLGRYMYGAQGIVFDVFPALLAMSLLSFPITFIYRFFIVDRERRKLQKNFSHYIDPVVVQKIADMGGNIALGGEQKDMTVLFSDIAGFTTLSEKLDPTLLFSMMTNYLSRMTDILIGQGGTLDKYIGDAVMGFFGAPLDMPDHAIRACYTALLMREALPAFNHEIGLKGIEPIDFRVGIASGEVIVGNIGSEERFNYTVLGDTVNVASRLEGIGKEYAVNIVISENTRNALDSRFFVRELDTIAAKGKTEGIKIFELLGGESHAKNLYAYERYAKALAIYREGNYRDAGILWEKQAQEDPPSRMMMERCLAVLRGDTHVENGVYHMTHK